MIDDKLLDDLVAGILKFLVGFRTHFLNLLQVVHSDVLIAIRLENFTRNFSSFKALRVDEVAEFASCATIRSVVVATGNCAEIARLDDLVHVGSSCSCLL